MYKRSSQGWIKHMDFILWDVFAQQLAFNLCYCLYNRTGALVYSDPDYRSLGILLALLDVAVAVLFNTMHGVLKRGYYQEAAQTLRQVALVFVGITLFLFTMKLGSVYSRVILSTTALTHFLFSYLFRLLWKRHLNRTADQHIKNSMILVAPEDAVGVVLGSQASADETRVVGVVLTVYLEQIVATLGDNEIIVGNAKVVVEIMHKRCLAGFVVLDVGLVEAVDIFALHQLRGLPVGIAVRNAVSQVLYFEVEIVEVYVEHIVTPQHIDGREIHVAHWRYLERLHIRVEDVNLRVLGSYSCHCKKAHYYNISYAFHI